MIQPISETSQLVGTPLDTGADPSPHEILSFAKLPGPDSRAHSMEYRAMSEAKVDGEDVDHPSLATPLEPLVLRVALRPIRVFLLTVFSISVVSVLVVYLNRGGEILRYHKDQYIEEDLVEQYNAYAGNVTSALNEPIKFFVTAAVQVLMLRFLSKYMLRAEPDRRVALFAMALSAGVGYLISNGFSAINVQARHKAVRPVIRDIDLSAGFNATALLFIVNSTTLNQTVSERQQSNPTTNTALRSLLLPRQPNAFPTCDWSNTQVDFKLHVAHDVLEFGMPARDWMENMIPQATASQKLRMVLNATDKNANQNVRAADLPMEASLAAELVTHSLFLSSHYLPWGRKSVWESTDKAATDRNTSTAALMGLLSPDKSKSELEQREWLLHESNPIVNRLFQGGTLNMSTSDIQLEFSHTQLSPTIAFDAVTFEVDTDPTFYTTPGEGGADNQARNLNLDPYQCKPFPGVCMLEKRIQQPLSGLSSSLLYDAPMQIHAFAMCLNENGEETLQSTLTAGNEPRDFDVKDCTRTSKSSLLLVGVGKRLVADRLVQEPAGTSTGTVVATNVRKIFSFTVGRLNWALQNLSTEFSAECGVSDGDCMGLSFNISQSGQSLVVSGKGLPMNRLAPFYYAFGVKQRPAELVQITEPAHEGDGLQYSTIAGDILLPHNVKDLQWDKSRAADPKACSANQEDRLRAVLNNHMYIETTLQSTYTAGMYFLFQDAVALDFVADDVEVVGLEAGHSTLDFVGNINEMSLWISTPLQNTILTLTGCMLLAVSLLGGLVWSLYGRMTHQPDPLLNITMPQVIARAMLDGSQFPSLLLHRRVVDTSDGVAQKTVAAFEIQSLMLQNQKNADHRVAATA